MPAACLRGYRPFLSMLDDFRSRAAEVPFLARPRASPQFAIFRSDRRRYAAEPPNADTLAPSKFMKNPDETTIVKMPKPTRTTQTASKMILIIFDFPHVIGGMQGAISPSLEYD